MPKPTAYIECVRSWSEVLSWHEEYMRAESALGMESTCTESALGTLLTKKKHTQFKNHTCAFGFCRYMLRPDVM